jgi:hypothetical protein
MTISTPTYPDLHLLLLQLQLMLLRLAPSFCYVRVCTNEDHLTSIYTSLQGCIFMWGQPQFWDPFNTLLLFSLG